MRTIDVDMEITDSGFYSFLRSVGKLLGYRPPVLVFRGAKAHAKADTPIAAPIALTHNTPSSSCVDALPVRLNVPKHTVCGDIEIAFLWASASGHSL